MTKQKGVDKTHDVRGGCVEGERSRGNRRRRSQPCITRFIMRARAGVVVWYFVGLRAVQMFRLWSGRS